MLARQVRDPPLEVGFSEHSLHLVLGLVQVLAGLAQVLQLVLPLHFIVFLLLDDEFLHFIELLLGL